MEQLLSRITLTMYGHGTDLLIVRSPLLVFLLAPPSPPLLSDRPDWKKVVIRAVVLLISNGMGVEYRSIFCVLIRILVGIGGMVLGAISGYVYREHQLPEILSKGQDITIGVYNHQEAQNAKFRELTRMLHME